MIVTKRIENYNDMRVIKNAESKVLVLDPEKFKHEQKLPELKKDFLIEVRNLPIEMSIEIVRRFFLQFGKI